MLFGWAAYSAKAQPPNNNIFYGGMGAGSNSRAFVITAANIFVGSTGDGFGNTSNNSQSNLIFTGGEGDGFNNGSNNSVSNLIFLGSEGDGFSNRSNNSVSNLIFYGGEGDGWSAVLIPLGPLPVSLLSFAAEAAGTTHLIKWVTTSEVNTKMFEVQRSTNGRDFVAAGNSIASKGVGSGAAYSFTVAQTWQGNNFYRLKMVDNDGSFTYSNIVLLTNMTAIQVSVYPNPTADWLYVSIPAFENSKPITASLIDGAGKLLAQPVLIAGNRNAIEVKTLPAGVYTLRCTIKQQNFVVRFIKQR